MAGHRSCGGRDCACAAVLGDPDSRRESASGHGRRSASANGHADVNGSGNGSAGGSVRRSVSANGRGGPGLRNARGGPWGRGRPARAAQRRCGMHCGSGTAGRRVVKPRGSGESFKLGAGEGRRRGGSGGPFGGRRRRHRATARTWPLPSASYDAPRDPLARGRHGPRPMQTSRRAGVENGHWGIAVVHNGGRFGRRDR